VRTRACENKELVARGRQYRKQLNRLTTQMSETDARSGLIPERTDQNSMGLVMRELTVNIVVLRIYINYL
jgi:hypothetical protein